MKKEIMEPNLLAILRVFERSLRELEGEVSTKKTANPTVVLKMSHVAKALGIEEEVAHARLQQLRGKSLLSLLSGDEKRPLSDWEWKLEPPALHWLTRV